MKQLIIIYELLSSNLNEKTLFENMIRKYDNYAFLSNNACIIWTDTTPVNVRDYLLQGLRNKDKIFVSEISAPAAWNNISKEVSEYIIKYLIEN